MNKDIRLNVSFWDHWKTVTLKAELGLEAIESLQRLWCFSAQNKPDGFLFKMSLKAIEISAQWKGIPGQFVSRLVELGFLDFDGKTYSLHDWSDHNGFCAHAKDRKEQAKNAAEARWIKKNSNADSNAERNAERNADSNAERNAPSPSPYPSPKQKEHHHLPPPIHEPPNDISQDGDGDGAFSGNGKKQKPQLTPEQQEYLTRRVAYQAEHGGFTTGKTAYTFWLKAQLVAGTWDMSDLEEMQEDPESEYDRVSREVAERGIEEQIAEQKRIADEHREAIRSILLGVIEIGGAEKEHIHALYRHGCENIPLVDVRRFLREEHHALFEKVEQEYLDEEMAKARQKLGLAGKEPERSRKSTKEQVIEVLSRFGNQ